MQFTITAVFVLALAVSARASVISLWPSPAGLPLQTVNINGVEGTAIAGLPAGLVVAGPGVIGGWPWAWPAGVQIAPAPVQVVAAPAPLQVVAAPATYVGQTRGAVHVAPLPGHTQSVSSVNLEAAPGSK